MLTLEESWVDGMQEQETLSLFIDIKENNLESARSRIENGAQVDWYDGHSLSLAIMDNNLEAVELLLEFNITMREHFLSNAVKFGYIEIVKSLLDNIDDLDLYLNTHRQALETGNKEIIDLFKSKKSDSPSEIKRVNFNCIALVKSKKVKKLRRFKL